MNTLTHKRIVREFQTRNAKPDPKPCRNNMRMMLSKIEAGEMVGAS